MCRAVYWALGIGAVKVVAYAHDERGHVNLFKIEAAERAGDAGIGGCPKRVGRSAE